MSMTTKIAKNSISKTEVRYIVNNKGERTEVVLPIELYEALLERIEDAEDIQALLDSPSIMREFMSNENKKAPKAICC